MKWAQGMYVLHQFIILFCSPTVSSTMCMQIVVLTEKRTNEHGQSDSWIAVDQASIDV